MNLPERIFAFYINSSIHVALAVVAFTAITVGEYNLTIPWDIYLIIFLSTLVGYNFVKYAEIGGLHHRKLAGSIKVIQIISAICVLLLVYIAFQFSLKVILLTAGCALATFFYAVPFLRHRNLRSLAGIKIFIVALVWAVVTVIIPVVGSEHSISSDIIITFIERFLIVVALTFPFEIRDVSYDPLRLRTFPQQIGVMNTKFLGEGLLLLCLVLEFFKEFAQTAYILSTLVFALALGGMLIVSKTEQRRYFSSFWVESLPILWYLLFVLFERI